MKLRAQKWYNDDIPWNLNGFLNDKTNRLIGWVTMRQLRIKSQLCSSERLMKTCFEDYSSSNEDKNSYYPGWRNQTNNQELSSSILNAFQYQDKDGYVYEFRGSLSSLQTNLSLLHQLEWIDERTRQIIIELTSYNPNVQLFTSAKLTSEFLSTGKITTTTDIQPVNFFGSLFDLFFQNEIHHLYFV